MEANEDTQAAHTAKVHRPESSASAHSKFTSQSSNSSSTYIQYRNPSGVRDRERVQDNDRRESTGPSLLQELLREKKASRLGEKHRSMDFDASVNVRNGPQSSPIRNASGSRTGRDRDGRPSSGGERALGRKPLGVKEMEEVLHDNTYAQIV
jgi:hypothetical protein